MRYQDDLARHMLLPTLVASATGYLTSERAIGERLVVSPSAEHFVEGVDEDVVVGVADVAVTAQVAAELDGVQGAAEREVVDPKLHGRQPELSARIFKPEMIHSSGPADASLTTSTATSRSLRFVVWDC